jgi:cytochrome c oxidase subunit 4
MMEHAEHIEHHAHDNSPEAVKREVRKYLIVFGCLALLTIITVWIANFHLPTWQAVTLALVVATIKGTLVAAFFMHLLSERKLIFAVLVLTVFFFGMMIWGPWHHRYDAKEEWPGYDASANQATATAPASEHGSGH